MVMGTLVELGAATLAQAERRVEVAGENIANVATSGYKRRVAFATLLEAATNGDAAVPNIGTTIDLSAGKLQSTGNPADLAIAGPGYFLVRSDDGQIYTRKGQFAVDQDGRLVNDRGFALQLESGNDVKVAAGDFEIRSDRTIVQKGVALGKVAVYESVGQTALEPVNGGFSATGGTLTLSEDSVIKQGMTEASNVSTGNEMVNMMESLRRAESGQRVINVYDDLMARVITTFGESVR
jgi:flagellar basal-body rod protein FlgF